MGQLHFITKLLDIKDTNIQIIDVGLRFLTLRQLVCLLEFSLESVDSSAITVQK
ncbi:transposase [Streptococcus pneumoniae]|nr:transposase [Streptococcus pneumoniae]